MSALLLYLVVASTFASGMVLLLAAVLYLTGGK